MASHSVFPSCLLALPKRDRVDCVDGASQENEPRYVHEQDFFESARVPEIDGFGADFDEEQLIELLCQLSSP